jgi:hypothetical protein
VTHREARELEAAGADGVAVMGELFQPGAAGLLAAHESTRDLIALGAYVRGKDPETDRALAAFPEIQRFLCQDSADATPFEETLERLQKLIARYGGA